MPSMSRSAQLVQLPAITDARVHLSVVDAAQNLGFPIERVLCLASYDESDSLRDCDDFLDYCAHHPVP